MNKMNNIHNEITENYRNRIKKNIQRYSNNQGYLLSYHIINIEEFNDIDSILYMSNYYYQLFTKEYEAYKNKYCNIDYKLYDISINKYVNRNINLNKLINYNKLGANLNNKKCIESLATIYNLLFILEKNTRCNCENLNCLLNEEINPIIIENFIKYNKMCHKPFYYINLGNYYKYYKNKDKMLKYYLKANNGCAFYNMANFYNVNKDIRLSIIYLYKSSLLNFEPSKKLFQMSILLEKNKINIYNILTELKNPDIIINNQTTELEKQLLYFVNNQNTELEKFLMCFIDEEINKLIKMEEIKKHINRLENSTKNNIIKECIICFDNKLNIKLDCCHELCIDCYNKTNNKCYYRCNQ
jgi:hypothetical protein